MKCDGCFSSIKDENYASCKQTGCSNVYCHLCIDIETTKTCPSWKCPECQAKVKKGSDNSATPLRKTHQNVTTRKPVPAQSQCLISIEEMRNMIREEIKITIKESLCDFRAEINQQLCDFRDQVKDFKRSIEYFNEQFEKFNTEKATYIQNIQTVSKENEVLRSELNALTVRFNLMDQLSRSANIELQCVPERKAENLLCMVKQLSTTVKSPVTDNDITYCSRIAKINSSSNRPRSILVKFGHPRTRDAFIAACYKYNKTHENDKLNSSHAGIKSSVKSRIFVAENLSPENKLLHAAARDKAKQLDYKFVWVRGGRIFVRKSENSNYILVKNYETLEKLSKS